jgi:branched-chain amino acid transport system substrate-binding protein
VRRRSLAIGVACLVTATVVPSTAISERNRDVTAARGSGPTASKLCKTARIGFASALTGGAAFLGIDQRNWVRTFVRFWNANQAIPGVPTGLKRIRIREVVESDTQLNPQVAATVATQMASNGSILAMVGFAGSQENLAGGPVLTRAGLAYISGSATLDRLTDGKTLGRNNFFRVVPKNSTQAAVGVNFMFAKLGLKSGQRVMVVDDAEAYGIGIADNAQARFRARGVRVDRASQTQGNTDYTSLAQKAVGENAKVVYAPTQIPSNSQLFAEQLKAAGYRGIFFGTDGSFDSTSFKFPGAYVSFFATDIYQVKIANRFTTDFSKRYGKTTPFGAPSFVAAQVIAEAISKSCADGKTTRSEVRRTIPKIRLSTSILGHPVSFDRNGDVKTGLPANGVTIFRIGANGSYKLVYG